MYVIDYGLHHRISSLKLLHRSSIEHMCAASQIRSEQITCQSQTKSWVDRMWWNSSMPVLAEAKSSVANNLFVLHCQTRQLIDIIYNNLVSVINLFTWQSSPSVYQLSESVLCSFSYGGDSYRCLITIYMSKLIGLFWLVSNPKIASTPMLQWQR